MLINVVAYKGIKSIEYLINELKERGLYTNGDCDLLIRWGSRAYTNFRYDKVINSVDAIKNTSNKKKMVEILKENNCAIMANTDFSNITFPCYVFMEKHAHGNGLFILTSPEDLRVLKDRWGFNPAYWSYLLPIKQEYRCHVCGDATLLLRKVYSKDKNPKPRKFMFLLRNRKMGYVFFSVKKWQKIHDRICNECIKAVKSLGLIFGAVDVATYHLFDGKLGINIFEVNSGASLSPRTAKFYVDNIVKLYEMGVI